MKRRKFLKTGLLSAIGFQLPKLIFFTKNCSNMNLLDLELDDDFSGVLDDIWIPAKYIFRNWYSKKYSEFKYPPDSISISDESDSSEFYFEGISPNMRGYTNEFSVSVGVFHKGDCWDFLFDYDIGEAKTDDGRYYCDICDLEHRKYYSTREELWEKHSFEHLLKWVNENFNETSWITLHSIKCGGTWARIVDEKDLEENQKCESYAHSFKVVL